MADFTAMGMACFFSEDDAVDFNVIVPSPLR